MRSCLILQSSPLFLPSKTPFLNQRFGFNSLYPSLITCFRPRNPNLFASQLQNLEVSWVSNDPDHKDEYNGWAVSENPVQNKKNKGGNFV